ncbi:MAG: Rpp14/Pop5 family protein [Candidatus Woesearchaeota archaeon]
MPKKEIKALLPTLREKKRYLAFKINSETKINDFNAIKNEILLSANYFIGDLGMAKANIVFLKDKFKENKGLIMVNRKYIEHLRASLALINNIKGIPVAVHSIGASGMIKKAEKYLD